MPAKRQFTGMTGVYLVAAELARLGFIVSPTSRSAIGADLLVTDPTCQHSYSVQVKTNAKAAGFWLMNKYADSLKSKTLIYVFVNLGKDHTDYFIVPSNFVAPNVKITPPSPTRTTTWYSVRRDKIARYKDKWGIFKRADWPLPPTSR